MIPVLFPSTATEFTSYGLGALSDAISCEVEEHRNGSYELQMEYPLTGIHYDEIALRSLILAKPNYLDDPQPFRVYQITKPINGVVTIYARHWSYDLSDIPVQPFTAAGIQSAMNGLISNAMYDISDWHFTTSRTTPSNFKVDEPSSVRSWFGGKEGSLLDIYGGEWHYDGRTCNLENSRGADKGVVIRYGVNLTDLQQEENCAEVYTGVLPYWKDMDGNLVQGSVQNVTGTFDFTRILVLDCSEDYDEAPTSAQLNAKAVAYITNNNVGVPKVNLTLNFATLRGNTITSFLANEAREILSNEDGFVIVAYGKQGMPETRVDLCDTVTVIFEKLGVRATAKCIRVRWNTLLDRYEEVELGDAKSELTEAIIRANTNASEAVKQVKLTKNILESDIETAVERVTGNLGGYVILHDSNGDGYPDELLIMNTPDIATATSVWRWNQQGLMWASSYTGQFATLAITNDGKITADAITTGTLRGIEIISDDGSNTVDIVNGKITTTGTTGSAIGKTETNSNHYNIYTASGDLVASLFIAGVNENGVWRPVGGMLSIRDESSNPAIDAWATDNGWGIIRVYDSQGNSAATVSGEGGLGGGLLAVHNSNGVAGRLEASTNGGNLTLYRGTVMASRITSTQFGGVQYFYWGDGTTKIYLGNLTLTGLMQDEPSLAFYDTTGAITSWYCGNRAYIKDGTSGSQGFVVHGQTGAHGITVDFTAVGRIDFYVDNTYVGYASLSSSDKKTKKSIKTIPQKYKDAVASVPLKSFHFNFKDKVLSGANDLLRFGAVAQDVISALEAQGIDPMESELVDKVGEGNAERYVINYIPFLTARLAADEDRIKTLEERLAKLEARLEAE